MNNTQPHTQVVILGAGYAGMMTALRLAQHTAKLPVSITLVNGTDTFVERIRLHQVAAAQRIHQRPIARLLRGTNIRFVRAWVTAIVPQSREITLKTDADEQTLSYDYLVYALGSTADKDSVPGVRQHTLAVGDPADAAQMRERLPQLAAANGQVVVVGGGLTGIEAASELAEAYPGLRVRLLTAGTLGAGLSEPGRAHLCDVFAQFGISVEEQCRIERVDAGAVLTANGERIAFDLCLWAGSFRALPLAQQAGLPVNQRGQILVDAFLRAIGSESIYAVGDAAAFVQDPGAPIRMACATGLPMGAQAADNLQARLLNVAEQPFGFGYILQCISLGRNNGLIQFVNADDSPTERILTGKAAAWVKEGVCRFARLSATTKLGTRLYRWPHQNRRVTQELAAAGSLRGA